MNRSSKFTAAVASMLLVVTTAALPAAESLKVHGIFRSHMVLQRDKPIAVWGWAPSGAEVGVTFGERSAKAVAGGEQGRW